MFYLNDRNICIYTAADFNKLAFQRFLIIYETSVIRYNNMALSYWSVYMVITTVKYW